MNIRKALTIAGSDSGGGAGIQADLNTFAALGVYGTSVITAITAQNTQGVRSSAGVDPGLVEEQLDAVLSDIGADAIKTGMLFDSAIIERITSRLRAYPIPPLVVDPVMISTSGDRLLEAGAVEILQSKLLPMSAFTTPNVDEASVLCGFSIEKKRDLHKAARELHLLGADFVIITGIRRGEQSIDACYDGFEFRELSGPFIDTPHTHGTGCSFSAALTAGIAWGLSPWSAAALAKKYVSTGLRCAYLVGAGRGPINHLASFFPGKLTDPDILEIRAASFQNWGDKPRLPASPLLNVILGGPLCEGKDYVELTRLAVKNGAALIQLREKDGDTRQLIDRARQMCQVCHEHNAIFVVNDRVDVAIASGADGVHIGQDDLAPQMARALLGPEKIIGVSAVNMGEAEAAVAAGADYLGVGPVYPTISKECKVEACEPGLLADIAARFPVPVIAIGGITPVNTFPLLQAGAAGVAVISAILGADDPGQVIRNFMKIIG
ncbi:MAG TPA: bifunctional hydroxymethylpyrimidine kinase/phosphomethylpyrimidine kinase [Syntrophomonadaceae bacterium]|nr:bifunctional hydroxymethylpyrimidine kinase/phosphomethylpyrimidine kinase [Syntrophomonadaceae bacterium]